MEHSNNRDIKANDEMLSAKQKLVQTFLKIFGILKWLAPLVLFIITFSKAYVRGYSLENWEVSALIIKAIMLFVAFWFGAWLLKILMNFRAKMGIKE